MRSVVLNSPALLSVTPALPRAGAARSLQHPRQVASGIPRHNSMENSGVIKSFLCKKRLILIIFTVCVLKVFWPNCVTTQSRWHKWTQSRNVHLREPQRHASEWIHYRKTNKWNSYRLKKDNRTTRQAIISQKLIKYIWQDSFRLKKKFM